MESMINNEDDVKLDGMKIQKKREYAGSKPMSALIEKNKKKLWIDSYLR